MKTNCFLMISCLIFFFLIFQVTSEERWWRSVYVPDLIFTLVVGSVVHAFLASLWFVRSGPSCWITIGVGLGMWPTAVSFLYL